jgi:periplasmic protein TonB
MRWSFWPVSISFHVVAVFAMFIVPLAADVSWPVPAPLHRLAVTTRVVPVPPEVIAPIPVARTAPNLPSVTAPTTLAPPVEPAPTAGLAPPDSLPLGGTTDLSFRASSGAVTLGPPLPPTPPPPAVKPATQMLRVGQGVREPRRIGGGPPEYPQLARTAQVQGVVMLEAVINERGTIERIKVLKSIPLLDGAAIAAVKDWRYTPTLLNGVPVSVLMTITVNFTLQD